MLSPLNEPGYHLRADSFSALPARSRPTAWSKGHYLAALYHMADQHAEWWNLSGEDLPWAPLPTVYDPDQAAHAKEALLKIERAPWAGRLLGSGRAGALLAFLDDPAPALDLLLAAPRTLIAGDQGFALEDGYPVDIEAQVCAGPAAYDLAGFYSSARWLGGSAPLTLTQSRNHYLERLAGLLPVSFDRGLFDMTFDAALAWRFAVLWPPRILEQSTALLAQEHFFQATVLEPALASMQRLRRL